MVELLGLLAGRKRDVLLRFATGVLPSLRWSICSCRLERLCRSEYKYTTKYTHLKPTPTLASDKVWQSNRQNFDKKTHVQACALVGP